MTDTFDWSVIIKLATQGAKSSVADVKQVSGALNELQATNKITDAQYQNLSKSLGRVSSAGRKASADLAPLSSPSLRYALYDVATTANLLALAITGVGVAAIATASSFERAFSNVERTLEPGSYGVQQLRGELMQLSREIPLSFQNISEIATLGNQLGIAGQDVAKFSETVAQFSSVTGLSIQETALAFGQLGNLLGVLPEDYDRLGSAIALVGVRSAATETQIVSIARELAPAAASAGFTAEQVIGLSGALGSLKVPPERSRSTILQFFETLNTAVANGGDDLENFARVVGVSAGELESLVRAGQGKSILERFIGRVSTADTVEITQALQELGLAGLRTNPTIRALAGNMEGLNSAFSDSAQGWTENTELARQYEITVETLASQWQLFLNALMEFGSAVGSSVLPAVASFLGVAQDVLHVLADFAESPVGQWVVRTVASIAALIAAFAGISGAVAGSVASMVALRFAVTQLGWAGATSGVQGFVAGLVGLRGGATAATGALVGLSTAFKVLGKATVVIGLLQLLISLFTDLGGTVQWVGRTLSGFFGWLSDNSLTSWGADLGKSLQGWANGIEGWGKTLPSATSDLEHLSDASSFWSATADGATASTIGLGDAVEETAAKVRTLTDYATDLSSVWARAFEIRFGGQQTLDTITKSFLDIRQAISDSQQKLRELNADIQGLNSDINIQKYFLSIAEQYGDVKRAEAIRAKLAETEAELAKKTAEVAKEQETQNKTLVGNSAAAINNRNTILGLVQQYQAHIGALASSGLSTDELARQTEQLRQDFITQATQLGFNRGELGLYEQSFRDVAVAVNGVPRDVTVNFNPDPALQALAEFAAKATEVGNSFGTNFGNGLASGITATEGEVAARATQLGTAIATNLQNAMQSSASKYSTILTGKLPSSASKVTVGTSMFDPGGAIKGFTDWWLEARKNLFGYSGGGFTGTGGMYDAAGIVHRGEYVIPKRDVNQSTGLPKHDALGRLQRGAQGRSSYAGGGYVNPRGGNGGSIDSFGPMAYMQLQQALKQIVTLDNGVIAGAVGRSNTVGTAVGSN